MYNRILNDCRVAYSTLGAGLTDQSPVSISILTNCGLRSLPFHFRLAFELGWILCDCRLVSSATSAGQWCQHFNRLSSKILWQLGCILCDCRIGCSALDAHDPVLQSTLKSRSRGLFAKSSFTLPYMELLLPYKVKEHVQKNY